MINRITIIGLVILIAAALAAVSSFLIALVMLHQQSRVFETTDAFDTYIQQQMEAHEVRGAAVALVEDGDVRYTQGYSLDAQEPITADSRFQIASVSKPLTAWGVMYLVQEGRLSLDASVNDLLSRWTFPASSFDVSSVTVRQLLSHTGGVSVGGYLGFLSDEPVQTLEESLINADDAIPETAVTLILEPGTQWRYSGGGYTVLQLLVEEVTGESFAEYMQQTIFNPLGMTQTGYVDELPVDLVPVYDLRGAQQPARRFTALAAAGVYSTANDMGRWLLATVRPEEASTVLDADTLAMMFTAQPASQGGGDTGFGLGYSLSTTFGSGIHIADHDGVNEPGWRSYSAVIPDHESGFAMLTNSPGGAALHHQTGCLWVTYITQDVTLACLTDAAVDVLPIMLGITIVLAMLGLFLRQRYTKSVSTTPSSNLKST